MQGTLGGQELPGPTHALLCGTLHMWSTGSCCVPQAAATAAGGGGGGGGGSRPQSPQGPLDLVTDAPERQGSSSGEGPEPLCRTVHGWVLVMPGARGRGAGRRRAVLSPCQRRGVGDTQHSRA